MRRALAALGLAAFLACAADAQTISGGGGAGGFTILAQAYPNTSITGVTTEQNVAAVPVPAGSMGPNGTLRVTLLLSMTNNANNKTAFVRFNATAGATTGGGLATTVFTSVASAQTLTIARNTGITNSQIALNTLQTPFGSGTSQATGAIDTTQPAWINIGIFPAVSTDTITLLGYTVELNQG